MINECTFSDVPSWLAQELLMRCPNRKWSVNRPPSIGEENVTILKGQERIPLDDPSPDDHREWEATIYLVMAGTKVSTTDLFLIDGHADDDGFPYYHEGSKLSEPEIISIYGTISLVGPRDVKNVAPTAYSTFRLVPGMRVYVNGQFEVFDENAEPDRFPPITIRKKRISASAHVQSNFFAKSMNYPFDLDYDKEFLFDQPRATGLTPPFWWDLDITYEILERVNEAIQYEFRGSYHISDDDVEVWDESWESGIEAEDRFIYDHENMSWTWDQHHDESQVKPSFLSHLVFDDYWEYFPLAEDVSNLVRHRSEVDLVRKLSTGPVNIGMAAASSAQTARMIHARGGQLLEALLALKRRDVPKLIELLGQPRSSRHGRTKRKGRDLRSLSPDDLFLEFSFGWNQLYNDINGAIQALFEEMYKEGQTIHVNVYRRSLPSLDELRVFSDENRNARDPLAAWIPPAKSIKILRGLTPAVDAVLDDEDYRSNYKVTTGPLSDLPSFGYQINSNWKVIDKIAKTLQALGVSTPAVTAWDLVPYSFISDWIFATDAIVKQITYDEGLERLPSSATTFTYWPVTVRSLVDHESRDEAGYRFVPQAFLITYRFPTEYDVSLSVADAIRSAAAPTRLFQVEVLTALLAQAARRY